MKIRSLLILSFAILIAGPLFSQKDHILYEADGFSFQYNLREADGKIRLAEILTEISGLSHFNDSILVAVQDEQGIVFHIHKETGEITKRDHFQKSGDFEGIEHIGKDLWIIESTGHLYHISEDRKFKKTKTFLEARNNAEGLTYDPLNNQLLIICKGKALKRKENHSIKAIYAYDLEKQELKKEPHLKIHLDSIYQHIHHSGMGKAGLRLLRFLNRSNKDLRFKPSGIAIHPKDGHYYILGAVGKLLVVLSKEGDLKSVVRLRESLFPQAEGICFSEDGDLYIASEGDKEDSFIVEFKPNK